MDCKLEPAETMEEALMRDCPAYCEFLEKINDLLRS
jgi:hypothetical protein